jgi:hypothetical protein
VGDWVWLSLMLGIASEVVVDGGRWGATNLYNCVVRTGLCSR